MVNELGQTLITAYFFSDPPRGGGGGWAREVWEEERSRGLQDPV